MDSQVEIGPDNITNIELKNKPYFYDKFIYIYCKAFETDVTDMMLVLIHS